MVFFRQTLFAGLCQPMVLRRYCCALIAFFTICTCCNFSAAQEDQSSFGNEMFAELQTDTSGEPCEVCTPEAANFGEWESLVDEESAMQWAPSIPEFESWRPFDSVRALGFRHSSTHGRHRDRGNPLQGTSWLNRPYHVDWFVGPLLGDELIRGRVNQENVLLGGLRIGWDFDYYWGMEWRYGRADPNAQFATPQAQPNEVSYSVSDISLIYYPWGDSKVRPYCLLGLGAAQIDFLDDTGINRNSTLLTTPLGIGIQFQQWSWMLWRLEILDNISYGDGSIATMHNVSFTAGMEIRLGARPSSYWPWRASRKFR